MTDAPLLALLPSPLLGPRVWDDVAARLRAAGREVVVPRSAGDDPGEVLAALLHDLPERALTLVPHSNAGLYVPAIAAARTVRAAIFVDARLPEGYAPTPPDSPAFLDHLRSLVGPDGRLPVWTDWWPADDVTELFPVDRTRAEVVAEQRRLPLTYFTAPTLGSAGPRPPAAYLAFGSTYADELAAARAAGWPTDQLEGRHLHLLVEPDAVTQALLGLEESLLVRPTL